MSEPVEIEVTLLGLNDLADPPRLTFNQAKANYDQCVAIIREQAPNAVVSPCPQWILDAIERGEGSQEVPGYDFDGTAQ